MVDNLGLDTLPTNFECWYMHSKSVLIKFNKTVYYYSTWQIQHNNGVIVCGMEVYAMYTFISTKSIATHFTIYFLLQKLFTIKLCVE